MSTPYVRLHGEPGSIYCTIVGANGEPAWMTAQGRGLNRRREVWKALDLIGLTPIPMSSGRPDRVLAPPPTAAPNQRPPRSWPIVDEVAKRRKKAAS